MKKFLLFFIVVFAISCSKEKHDLTVKGNIKGLKKGTVYLKKAIDTLLVTVDSLEIKGNSQFELHSDIESPEMFYLFLDKNDNQTNSIAFFANKGVTEINTSLKNFVFDAKIEGSNQQKIYEEYKLMISKFNDKNLDLLEENFLAQKVADTTKLNANQQAYENLIKRRYLFAVNFAITHKNSEVAPYIALSEIYDANFKLLDTINKSLTPEIKQSKYGKQLEKFLDERKADEANKN